MVAYKQRYIGGNLSTAAGWVWFDVKILVWQVANNYGHVHRTSLPTRCVGRCWSSRARTTRVYQRISRRILCAHLTATVFPTRTCSIRTKDTAYKSTGTSSHSRLYLKCFWPTVSIQAAIGYNRSPRSHLTCPRCRSMRMAFVSPTNNGLRSILSHSEYNEPDTLSAYHWHRFTLSEYFSLLSQFATIPLVHLTLEFGVAQAQTFLAREFLACFLLVGHIYMRIKMVEVIICK